MKRTFKGKDYRQHWACQHEHAVQRAKERCPHPYRYYKAHVMAGETIQSKAQTKTKIWHRMANQDGTYTWGLWSKTRGTFITFYDDKMIAENGIVPLDQFNPPAVIPPELESPET